MSGNSYPGGSLELDAYGYVYPGANVDRSACGSAAVATPCALPSKRFDTLELNAGVTWKWLAYKLSVSTGDYFGAVDAGYTDYQLALMKTFAGDWNVGASVVGANDDRFHRPPVGGLPMANGATRAVNRAAFIVQAGRTFWRRALTDAATPRASRRRAAARRGTCRRRAP